MGFYRLIFGIGTSSVFRGISDPPFIVGTAHLRCCLAAWNFIWFKHRLGRGLSHDSHTKSYPAPLDIKDLCWCMRYPAAGYFCLRLYIEYHNHSIYKVFPLFLIHLDIPSRNRPCSHVFNGYRSHHFKLPQEVQKLRTSSWAENSSSIAENGWLGSTRFLQ